MWSYVELSVDRKVKFLEIDFSRLDGVHIVEFSGVIHDQV